jgi:branched-chain amino acid transport system ATP-binding protein
MVQEIGKIITAINRKGVSIMLVEQNASMALRLSHRSYVLEIGKVTLEGNSGDILSNKKVKEAYLGEMK